MKFNVPSYSQYLDIKNKEWQDRACGIIALKSILDFWSDENKKIYPDGDKLVEIGLELNAYIPDIGWRHKELVDIAKSLDLDGKNFDWFKKTPEEAFQKMFPYLEKYPLAASVHPLFETQNQGGHLVVLTGFENNILYYNDPASEIREEIAQEIPLDNFLKGWKRRIIAIYPKSADL
ncbi:MAG: C39 family peptidase [Candidatus Tagabacteria bacterium]